MHSHLEQQRRNAVKSPIHHDVHSSTLELLLFPPNPRCHTASPTRHRSTYKRVRHERHSASRSDAYEQLYCCIMMLVLRPRSPLSLGLPHLVHAILCGINHEATERFISRKLPGALPPTSSISGNRTTDLKLLDKKVSHVVKALPPVVSLTPNNVDATRRDRPVRNTNSMKNRPVSPPGFLLRHNPKPILTDAGRSLPVCVRCRNSCSPPPPLRRGNEAFSGGRQQTGAILGGIARGKPSVSYK